MRKIKKTLHRMSIFCLVIFLSITCLNINAQEDLLSMSMEELMNIKVTTVSRTTESVMNSPAAIYVITNEEIKRSPAQSIPELLRMVPGLHVSRIEANKWAVTTRGFNGRFARHMLVMIDGKTIYTPLFSGVFWENYNLFLQDIERIEVLRGSGGTMWGANAVNGVINIITKKAEETKGYLLSAGIGTELENSYNARYGSSISENLSYRIYGKGFEQDSGKINDSNDDGDDDWHSKRMGFRMDWDPVESDSLSLSGDYYDGRFSQKLLFPLNIIDDATFSGGNISFSWEKILNEDSKLNLNLFYTREERAEALFEEKRDTGEIDFQHSLKLSEKQNIIWGLTYRFSTDDIKDRPPFLTVDNESQDDHLFAGFMQTTISLIPDELDLTLGSKFEHNDYSGFEYSPSVRLAYTPDETQCIWAAVSRAVRTPSRIEYGARSQIPPITGIPQSFLVGNSGVGSEKLHSYELGYRKQIFKNLSLDITTFYNQYHDLQSLETSVDFPNFRTLTNVDNQMSGEAYGTELSIQCRLLDWWRLKFSYAYMQMCLHPDSGSNDNFTELFENDIPSNTANIISEMDLYGNTQLNIFLNYVDEIDEIQGIDIDNYINLDIKLAWKPTENLEISLTGYNLLDKSRYEYGPSLLMLTEPTEVERSVFLQLTWEM
ncbi:MAG: TonB-dependent receptor [Verrucomicrobiota bacterium]|nr:TonB-dependent receptor [Verrucomicrobiota bacterium]